MKRTVFMLIVLCSLCLGCSLFDVHERGDKCPADGDGDIFYISSENTCTSELADKCVVERNGKSEEHDFSFNFEEKVCPWQFPACTHIEIDGQKRYACEERKKEKQVCAEGEYECPLDNGKVKCVDPFSNKTCGASSCDEASNYGGQNCRLFKANCEETGQGGYVCVVDDQKRNVVCGGKMIDPSDKTTCGANDCSAENYGGTACNELENCRFNGSYFECIQPVCDEQCLLLDADNIATCVNTDNKCGPECKNCREMHDNASCTNGVCTISVCNEGEHPVYEGKRIVQCEKTSVDACASQKITIYHDILNCNETKPEHASAVDCSRDGTCIVTLCDTGYFINEAQNACLDGQATSCPVPGTSEVKDCTKIENAENVKCENGECIVMRCATDFHISKDSHSCVKNDKYHCGAMDSSIETDCTKIPNAADTECFHGVCKVLKCNADFHLNRGLDGCEANTDIECGKVDDSTTVNCTALGNMASSSSGKCLGNQCVISECAKKYHLSADKSKCMANSNTSCAPVNSNDAKDCSANKYEIKCNEAGMCACTTDGSKVLNYDKNACVVAACQGIPGVKAGKLSKENFYNTSVSDYRCVATTCSSGYTLSSSVCRPKASSKDCSDLGYKYNTSSGCNGYCSAYGSACSRNSHDKCKSGYREHRLVCLPSKYCCGTRNDDMSKSSDYTCRNCIALGKTKCNTSTGKCE